jgi:hypothetical protein
MTKLSRKNIRNKKGGECEYYTTQFNKVKSVLGPNGLESKIVDELHNSLSGVNTYLENFLLAKITKLKEIFNSNTSRKSDILEIIKQLEGKLKEVEQKNTACYDDLIVDPRGDDFATKIADDKIIEIYGENPEDYNKATVNKLYNLLNDNPVAGPKHQGIGQPPSVPTSELPLDSDETKILDGVISDVDQESDESSSNILPWKKINSEQMFKSFDGKREMNFVKVRSHIKNYLRDSKNKKSDPKRHVEVTGILDALVKATTPDEVQTIINDNELELVGDNKAGGKSKRINKTRKYRSRRQ